MKKVFVGVGVGAIFFCCHDYVDEWVGVMEDGHAVGLQLINVGAANGA